MKKIKVSVIVPIYNTEKFLEKCIESILNQTLEEIEIILIIVTIHKPPVNGFARTEPYFIEYQYSLFQFQYIPPNARDTQA